MGVSGKFFGISFGIGPFRFGASTGGGGGGGGDFTDGELDFLKICLIGIGAASAAAGFRWLINETVGGFNLVYLIICPAVIWAGGAFISLVMQAFLGDFSMRRKTSFFELVVPLVISLLSPWTFVIAMRDIPLSDPKLWKLSGPEKQKLYGSSFADLAPLKTWLMVIIGGYLLVLLVVCLKELLLSFLTTVYLRRRQRNHDKSLMVLHQETVKERGFTSVSELKSHLAEVHDVELKQMLDRRNREAKEARKAENLKNYADKVREAQSKASKTSSKEMLNSILDELNDKVKVKFNPDVGEAITEAEMVEAFQHARRRVYAATGLMEPHRSVAREQIGKLAYLLLNEAGWDVLGPTPMEG